MATGNREKLIETGLDMLAEKSYSQITMDEVAERSGVTKPMVYYYFENKDGFYMALAKHMLELGKAAVVKALDPRKTLREALYDLVEMRLEKARNESELTKAFMMMLQDPNIHEIISDTHRELNELFAIVRPTIERARKSGEIDPHVDPNLLLMMVNSASMGYTVRILKGIDHPPLPDPRRIVDVIFDGIAGDGEESE